MRVSSGSKKKVVTGGLTIGGVTIGGTIKTVPSGTTVRSSRGVPIATTSPTYRSSTTDTRHVSGTTTHYDTGLRHHHSTIGSRSLVGSRGTTVIGGTHHLHPSQTIGGGTSTFTETKVINGQVVYNHNERSINGVRVQNQTYGANPMLYTSHNGMIGSSLNHHHRPGMIVQQPGIPMYNPNYPHVVAPVDNQQQQMMPPSGSFLDGLVTGPPTQALVGDIDYDESLNQCTMIQGDREVVNMNNTQNLNQLISTLQSTQQTAETEAKLNQLLFMLETQQELPNESKTPVDFEKASGDAASDSFVSNNDLTMLIQQLQAEVADQQVTPVAQYEQEVAPATTSDIQAAMIADLQAQIAAQQEALAAPVTTVESQAAMIADLQAQVMAQNDAADLKAKIAAQQEAAAATVSTAESQADMIAQLQAQITAQQEALQIAKLQAQLAAQQEQLRATEGDWANTVDPLAEEELQ